MIDIEVRGPQSGRQADNDAHPERPNEMRTIRGLTDVLITIGRDASNHVALDDRGVSRRHAQVNRDGSGLWISNFSSNGTLVDGRRVNGAVRIGSQNLVRIGLFQLRFVARPNLDSRNGLIVQPSEPDACAEHVEPAAQAGETVIELRRRLHRELLERLDLAALGPNDLKDAQLRPRVLAALDTLLDDRQTTIPMGVERQQLRKDIADETLGLGPLEDLIADPSISEIMVVDRETIYVERAGRVETVAACFTSDAALRAVIERIVTPLGRRIDESQPIVDARLRDGSRVNAIIPPLALRGPAITIRKFSQKKLTVQDLLRFGSLDERMARFLERAVRCRRNIVISGGTGSGKTTLLNILSNAIPSDERIVTVEDAAELHLAQPHVVSLETRPANMEGRGEYTIRDLVKNTLRMRPDRVIVGECRGGEALDMLQAMNTGHDGSLTTVHANNPSEAISRIETLCLMAGLDLPSRAIREQIAAAVDLIVQVVRLADGSRRITHISEVSNLDEQGNVVVEDIFTFARTSTASSGKIDGEFRATGYLPSFLGEFIRRGLCEDGQYL